jgi:hypothetical protein
LALCAIGTKTGGGFARTLFLDIKWGKLRSLFLEKIEITVGSVVKKYVLPKESKSKKWSTYLIAFQWMLSNTK